MPTAGAGYRAHKSIPQGRVRGGSRIRWRWIVRRCTVRAFLMKVTTCLGQRALEPQRVDSAEWIIAHIRIPVPTLRIRHLRSCETCRIRRDPSSRCRMVLAEQEIVQARNRILVLTREA